MSYFAPHSADLNYIYKIHFKFAIQAVEPKCYQPVQSCKHKEHLHHMPQAPKHAVMIN